MHSAICRNLLLSLGIVLLLVSRAQGAPTADAPFVQETHSAHPIGEDAAANDVRAVDTDAEGNVWAATGAGVFMLPKADDSAWIKAPGDRSGPAMDVAVFKGDKILVGAWDGAYGAGAAGLSKVEEIKGPIGAVSITGQDILFGGPNGLWRVTAGGVTEENATVAGSVRALLQDPSGLGLWIATGNGLFRKQGAKLHIYREQDDILSSAVMGIDLDQDGRLWAGGLGGVTIFEKGTAVERLTPEDGLPTIYVQCVKRGPDGRMWVGTNLGVTRWDGEAWSLRHSLRWLLSDDVRDIAFDAEGTAWIATAAGVSAIKQGEMTLASKAAYMQEVSGTRHVRPPGLVEKCRLPKAGDISVWEPEDDDNDGEYTGMYLSAQSLRYAATGDPEAKKQAKSAFEAMRFLETVTGAPGFVARTVIPPDWDNMHDGNRTYTEEERAGSLVRDPRYKPVEVRWRPSADGKWLWKGDTSSDEVTGHFSAFFYYYEYCADADERKVVAAHVREIMDYIIEGGYNLIDPIDGKHTRWGVWAPERLNGDPNWAAERGINSVELLSYLKTTYHMTGDEKYEKEYRRLIFEEGFDENVRTAKTFAPAWRTHIDDELLALTYPPLITWEKDPELSKLYRESLDRWYGGIAHDENPYFNYVYASLTESEDPRPEDSTMYLRDAPLDLVNWRIDNSTREDIDLVRRPNIEPLQTSRLMPPSERGVVRWDKNPWEADQGDGGHTEWAPTSWLLAYWMGRNFGYIGAP